MSLELIYLPLFLPHSLCASFGMINISGLDTLQLRALWISHVPANLRLNVVLPSPSSQLLRPPTPLSNIEGVPGKKYTIRGPVCATTWENTLEVGQNTFLIEDIADVGQQHLDE